MTHHEHLSNDTESNAESSGERYEVPPDASSAESVSSTVTEAVSAVTGADAKSLRPLYEVIDPDALNRLISSLAGTSGRKDTEGWVAFRYEERMIRVFGDGRVVVAGTDEK